jgi:hypothetical protein
MSNEDGVGSATSNNVHIRSNGFATPQYEAEEFILSDWGEGATAF